MINLINQLASIQVESKIVESIKADDIYRDFSRNFKKLDELKSFRSGYEQKNAIMRWWDNDQLEDAQLNSAEVQAAFSKTMGQLMVIGLMQSKQLSSQQGVLNEQQLNLNRQAEEISKQTRSIDTQQRGQAVQTAELKQLIEDYFQLKGLTEQASVALVALATETRNTKEATISEVSRRMLEIRQAQDHELMGVEREIEALRIDVMKITSALAGQQNTIAGLNDRFISDRRHLWTWKLLAGLGLFTGLGSLIFRLMPV